MNGCVYRTANNQCQKYSDHVRNTMSWCVGDEPCEGRTPSNADRIRGMTDEELAHLLHTAEEHLFSGNLWNYEQWRKWLKSPVKEVDNG